MGWEFYSSLDDKLDNDFSVDKYKILPKIEIKDDLEINL
jgi:hypothetical protein